MEKEFVPYTLALRMKALGFNEPCFAHFRGFDLEPTTQLSIEFNTDKNSEFGDGDYWFSAPLYQQAFKWFRDKHELFGSSDISNFENKTYGYTINSLKSPHYLHSVKNFKSIKEAELACLEKLLEIVESKSK